MPTSRPAPSPSTKAFEICYAAFRVGALVDNRVLSEHLEAWALALLEAVNGADQEKGNVAIINLEYILSLARDLNFLSQVNSDIFLQELTAMKSAIAELITKQSAGLDLAKIFHREPLFIDKKESIRDQSEVKSIEPHFISNGASINSAMRQSAIIEKIRQEAVCRLKDIQQLFPDTSERTIRYDVQDLIERGILARIGNGGPATAYRLAEENIQNLPVLSYPNS